MNLGRFFGNFESEELRRFENLDMEEKQIVFYSENQNSWIIFESLINNLINSFNITICYVTSSKEEPILKSSNEKVKSFFIGDGIVRTKFFLNLKANILIMTMPDLGTFHIKRSKVYPVHYLYMFHAMLSTHLVYRKKAFDQFDTIFCVGDYQIEEIRNTEKVYDLKPKQLVKFGYNHLDNLMQQYSNKQNTSLHEKKITQILLAPGWGKNGIFETIIEEMIDFLLNAKYKVIFRPHPMTQKKSKKKIDNIYKKFSSNPNFVLEQDIPNFESFVQSDIMISDWSGVALEFAFTFERPVIYIDVPKKIHNPDFKDIPQIPIEESIRDKIGLIILPSEIKSIPKKIEELEKKGEKLSEEIRKVRDKTIFNIGTSTRVGAAYIIELLKELNHS